MKTVDGNTAIIEHVITSAQGGTRLLSLSACRVTHCNSIPGP